MRSVSVSAGRHFIYGITGPDLNTFKEVLLDCLAHSLSGTFPILRKVWNIALSKAVATFLHCSNSLNRDVCACTLPRSLTSAACLQEYLCTCQILRAQGDQVD